MSLASTLPVPQHLPIVTGRIMGRSEGKDWSELLARVRADEPAAQQELVAALWPQVSGRIQGLCPRRDSVEDLAQDVFVKIFAKLSQYRGGLFEAWVDQITRNVCYDALRKQRIRPEWTFTDVGEEAEEPVAVEGGDMNNVDALEVLTKLFQLLPDEVAWLLREVELKERSISQVAEEMGWTNTATRLRLFRARKKLKKVFNQWNQSHEA